MKLTRPQARILALVQSDPGTTCAEIADRESMPSRQTVSNTIARLVMAGCVMQTINPANRRERQLWATDAGIAALNVTPASRRGSPDSRLTPGRNI